MIFTYIAIVVAVCFAVTYVVIRIYEISKYQSMSFWATCKTMFSLVGSGAYLASDAGSPIHFYRRYRIQNYNGKDKDLIITHAKLIQHPLFSQVEAQFLLLKFDEEGDVVIFEDCASTLFEGLTHESTFRVIVISEDVGNGLAIANRLQQIGYVTK